MTSEQQYQATIASMNQFIDKGELTPDELEYLTLLGTLVAAYEDEQYPDEAFELRGITLIKALLQEENLNQSHLLRIFKTKSIASAVLNGKRRLTVEHIDGLAAHFNLPHELFFETKRSPEVTPTEMH